MALEVRVQQAIDVWLNEQRRRIEVPLRRCDSPIEQLFLLACLNEDDGEIGSDLDGPDECNHAEAIGAPHGQLPIFHIHYIYVYQQFPLELDGRKIRLDFAMFCRDAKVAIELDGHEFHERTKDQAERDKSRDRLLQAAGWHVLRFTGSEVWRDAGACAQESIRTAFRLGDGE